MGRIDSELRKAPGSQKVKHPGYYAAQHTKDACAAVPPVPAKDMAVALLNQLATPDVPNYATTQVAKRLGEGVGTVAGHAAGLKKRFGR